MNSKTNKIPVKFKKFFWDCDFNELSIQKHIFFIAERILNFGNQESLRWLFEQTDRTLIQSVIKKSRNLPAKTKNFWIIILND